MSTVNPSLYTRTKIWSSRGREGWRWEDRPAHRDMTIAAVKQQEAVGYHVQEDRQSLEKVEKDLKVLDLFLQQTMEQDEEEKATARGLETVDVDAYEANLRRIDTDNIDDVMGMMSDCLAYKRRLQAQRQRRKQQHAASASVSKQAVRVGLTSEASDDERHDPAAPAGAAAPPPMERAPLNMTMSEKALLSSMPSPAPLVLKPQKRPRGRPLMATTATTITINSTPSHLPPPPMATPGINYKELPANNKFLPTGSESSHSSEQGDALTTLLGEPKGGPTDDAAAGSEMMMMTPAGVPHHHHPNRAQQQVKKGLSPSKGGGPKAAGAAGGGGGGGGDEGEKKKKMRCTLNPERLDCLKRHEEAVRKRREAVRRARDDEDKARTFKARPLPRCVRETRWSIPVAPPFDQPHYDDYYYNRGGDGAGYYNYPRGPYSDNGGGTRSEMGNGDDDDDWHGDGAAAAGSAAPLSLPGTGRQQWPGQDPYNNSGMDPSRLSSLSLLSLSSPRVMGHHYPATTMEGTSMLQRQREWNEARERKLSQARALKELSALVEVQDKPDLSTTRSSWEKAKLQAEEARIKAMQQEREKQELEDLKQQVVRAKYKALYAGNGTTTTTHKAKTGAQRKQHRRHRSEPVASSSSMVGYGHDGPLLYEEATPPPARREWGTRRVDKEEDDDDDDGRSEELDEIQVMNAAPAACYMSPHEEAAVRRRRRRGPSEESDPFAQMLAEKPLNEVQRFLAEKFNISALQQPQPQASPPPPSHEKGSVKTKGHLAATSSGEDSSATQSHGKKAALKASRLGSYESCIQAYTSMVVRPPLEKPRVGARRRPRVRSDTAVSSLSGLETMLGFKPGSTSSTTGSSTSGVVGGGKGKDWGKMDEESWRALMGESAEGVRKKAGAGDCVEKRLQEVFDMGMDALKAAFHPGTTTEGLPSAQQPPHPMAADRRGGTSGGDDDDSSSTGSAASPIGSRHQATGGGGDVMPSVEMSDDEVSRLINEFTGPAGGNSTTTTHGVDDDQHRRQRVMGGVSSSSSSLLPPRPRASIRDQLRSAITPVPPASMQPYERYDQGFVQYFFDPTSTADKGRFRVYDARDFLPESMHRKPDPGSLEDGITLLMGKTVDPPHTEKVITIMFDRRSFSTEDAQRWWDQNRERFVR